MDMMAAGLFANAFPNPAHLLFLQGKYRKALFPSPP
jgi:hypothetical protein